MTDRATTGGWASATTSNVQIVVLEGDQTGQELLEDSLRVLQRDVIGFQVSLQRFNWRWPIAGRRGMPSCTRRRRPCERRDWA